MFLFSVRILLPQSPLGGINFSLIFSCSLQFSLSSLEEKVEPWFFQTFLFRFLPTSINPDLSIRIFLHYFYNWLLASPAEPFLFLNKPIVNF